MDPVAPAADPAPALFPAGSAVGTALPPVLARSPSQQETEDALDQSRRWPGRTSRAVAVLPRLVSPVTRGQAAGRAGHTARRAGSPGCAGIFPWGTETTLGSCRGDMAGPRAGDTHAPCSFQLMPRSPMLWSMQLSSWAQGGQWTGVRTVLGAGYSVLGAEGTQATSPTWTSPGGREEALATSGLCGRTTSV